jgi:hypothetical protein
LDKYKWWCVLGVGAVLGALHPKPWILLNLVSNALYQEVDQEQLASTLPPVPPLCNHVFCGGCWKGYPQSRFPNWTRSQVDRSKIADAIDKYDKLTPCGIFRADVLANGIFKNGDSVIARDDEKEKTWDTLIQTIVRRSVYELLLGIFYLRITCVLWRPTSY